MVYLAVKPMAPDGPPPLPPPRPPPALASAVVSSSSLFRSASSPPPLASNSNWHFWTRRTPSAPSSSPHYVPYWTPASLPTPPEVPERHCVSMPPLARPSVPDASPLPRRPSETLASTPQQQFLLKLPPATRPKRWTASNMLPPPPPPPPAPEMHSDVSVAASSAAVSRLEPRLEQTAETLAEEATETSPLLPTDLLVLEPAPLRLSDCHPILPLSITTPPILAATPSLLPPPPSFRTTPPPPAPKGHVTFKEDDVEASGSPSQSGPSSTAGYLDSVDALGIELPTPTPIGGLSARDANSTDTDLIFLESIARRENPEGFAQPGKLHLALQLSEECDRVQNKDAWELADLLRKPHLKAVLGTHDVVTGQTEEPDVLWEFQQPEIMDNVDRGEVVMVAFNKIPNEPLGMTVQVDENGNLLIARILAGGLIERKGILHVGDVILEVNGYPVESPEMLQERITYSKGAISLKVAPNKDENVQNSHENASNVTAQNGVNSVCFMRALFNYNPMEDTLLPCKEIGLEFQHGDILQIVNQNDPNWWQAKKVGWNGPAGLIPSQELEERRKAFVAPDADYVHKIGICGTRISKKKKKIRYQSKSNTDYDKAELLLYEEVTRMPPFKRRTLALVGSQGVGRRTLKNRLINSNVDKFGTVIPYTSRPQRDYEDNGKCYWFVDRETMESDIRNHKFFEYGEHKGHLYGTTLDSIREIINEGKMCVLDCSPAALKVLHNSSEFMPYVIFIAAPGVEQLKSLHNYGRGSRNMMFDRQSSIRFSSQRARTLQSLQTMFEEEDLLRMVEESACLQRTYEKYIDYVIVNEDHDETFRKVVQQLDTLSSEHQWVPVNWVY